MSRVGKQPVSIPEGVTVEYIDNIIKVKGPKGELTQWIDPIVGVKIEDNQVLFSVESQARPVKAKHGLYRNLTVNMVNGVSVGVSKSLELIGVGFDAQIINDGLYLDLGLSHAVYMKPPKEIVFEVVKPKGKIEAPGTLNQYLIATITVRGIDKGLVGQLAAKVREQRKPDVYKSKGIRYVGERVQLKAGKTGAT